MQKMNLERKFLRTQEVMGRLGIGYVPLLKLIRNGELFAIRLGRQYRISEEELEKFLVRKRGVVKQHED